MLRFGRADPNVMSETGFTSLILAAAGGHLEVVKTLVEKVTYGSHMLFILFGHRLLVPRALESLYSTVVS